MLIDIPEVQALSVREKLQLVDEIWVSIAPEMDALAVSDEEKALLDGRWSAYLKEPTSALTVAQFKEQVKALRA